MRYLVPLTLVAKVLAYAAITYGAWQLATWAGWLAGGALGWWLIKEEIEPWVALVRIQDERDSD